MKNIFALNTWKRIKCENIEYIQQILNQHFLVSGNNIRIFTFYLENNFFIIKLVQKIKSLKNYSFLRTPSFLTSFLFDVNLYREYDIYEMEQDRKKKLKNKEDNEIPGRREELIANSNRGIYIFEKLEEKDNLIRNNNYEEINRLNIDNHLNNWNSNPFKYKIKLSFEYNYDVVQVNFKYLAGTIKHYLCLYSMETYEIITKFKVNTSNYSDRVISMLSPDIICIGGNDTISLISIKDFEVILIYLIKPNYKISEICVLPDFNIIICMRSDDYSFKEYLFHYKYNNNLDKLTNIINHNLTKVSSELVTNKKSNLTISVLNKNYFVTIAEKKYIQKREIKIWISIKSLILI